MVSVINPAIEATLSPISFHPKGSMCMTCKNASNDCSKLPFSSMPVIEKYDSVAKVRCIQHIKKVQTNKDKK